jgi:hypothetical protein
MAGGTVAAYVAQGLNELFSRHPIGDLGRPDVVF